MILEVQGVVGIKEKDFSTFLAIRYTYICDQRENYEAFEIFYYGRRVKIGDLNSVPASSEGERLWSLPEWLPYRTRGAHVEGGAK